MEFTIKTKIKATAEEIYKSWLNSEGHTNMTGGKANISDKVGEPFTAWDGYLEGKNVELIPFSKIVQSWRSSQFKEGEKDSKIEVVLSETEDETEDETELILTHSNVPEDGEHYIKGWEEHYFQPMKAYFDAKK